MFLLRPFPGFLSALCKPATAAAKRCCETKGRDLRVGRAIQWHVMSDCGTLHLAPHLFLVGKRFRRVLADLVDQHSMPDNTFRQSPVYSLFSNAAVSETMMKKTASSRGNRLLAEPAAMPTIAGASLS